MWRDVHKLRISTITLVNKTSAPGTQLESRTEHLTLVPMLVA